MSQGLYAQIYFHCGSPIIDSIVFYDSIESSILKNKSMP